MAYHFTTSVAVYFDLVGVYFHQKRIGKLNSLTYLIPMRTINLFLTFYNNFFLVTLLLSLSCGLILYVNSLNALVFICWFKVLTSAIIMLYINKYKIKEFYYYRNLGVTKAFLFTAATLCDSLVFFLILALSYNLR
jgi:hypothetical protein